MATDYSRIKSALVNSKFQTENNAMFQSVLDLINATQNLQSSSDSGLANAIARLNSLQAVTIYQLDTRSAPVSVSMSDYLTASAGLVIFKDLYGNAGSNNITIVGSIEGATDPVISSNYGTYRAFLGDDVLFHTW